MTSRLHDCYIGSPGARIAYQPPDALISADPVIRVIPELVEAAAEPGGFLNISAEGTEPGSIVRFVFDDAILVYRVRGEEDFLTVLEWPD
jgi:hypothetical protein